MVLVILLLLIVGEVVTAYGGLWLVFTWIREGEGLLAALTLAAIIPTGAWVAHRILKAFVRP